MIKRVMLVAVATALLVSGMATGASAAPAPWPGLKIIPADDSVELVRYGDEPIYPDLGIYAVAGARPFELWLKKANYRAPVRVTQHDRVGRRSRFLADVTSGSIAAGLKDFFIMTVSTTDGTLVKKMDFGLCPDAWDRIRLTISAPETNRFPAGCSDHPFATGSVIGIEAGWGAPIRNGAQPLALADGEYRITVTVRYQYRRLFSIAEKDATAAVTATVTTYDDCCDVPPPIVNGRSARAAALKPVRPSGAPATPAFDTRPDLVAVPAWGIQMDDGSGGEVPGEPRPLQEDGDEDGEESPRDILRFAATVWNAGPAPLVVDGFRNKGDSEMTGYQSFYKNGKRVGWSQIGSFEYDDRPGHEHWHFRDFAQYRLLDIDGNEVMPASKEAFCLAPTNAMDMTVPGADWSVFGAGLPGTMCGSRSALAIREVLQPGWADTYGAYTPGQEFDVTDLPNGRYVIETTANPGGRLFERTTKNNVAMREIEIGGVAGKRTVVARPFQGVSA